MANQQHVQRLIGNMQAWNRWRKRAPHEIPDLNGADLRERDLRNADLHAAHLRGASLMDADLRSANLSSACLKGANFSRANLSNANMSRANLQKANLCEASLDGTRLLEADCSDAILNRARLVKTVLSGAILTGCTIYGISVWDVRLDGARQSDLRISDTDQEVISVDDLNVAQFIYLLLDNKALHRVIEEANSRLVLILGRFTPPRKAVLDALRNKLRQYNYLPVVFDFEKPSKRGFTETIITLASLSRFIIADLTDASSVPQELYAIVPHHRIPIQPIVQAHQSVYVLFKDLKKYPWMLDTYVYKDRSELMICLQKRIIEPVEKKVKEL